MGGAESLRRPEDFVSGVHKKCSAPETVGNFIMGGAKSLRRPTNFRAAGGAQEPETAGNLIILQLMARWDARVLSPAYNLYIRHTGFYEGQKISLQDCTKV